jgi:uncharacterized protein (TIGR03067 family)
MTPFRGLILVSALLAGSGFLRADDKAAKAPADLQGCWKLVAVEADDQSREYLGGGQPRWVIKGDKVFFGSEEIIRITTDPKTSPRIIDLQFRDPERVYEGIYVVEKDKLKICVNRLSEGKKDRPSGFSTKDQSDWRLFVFEREKAPPAEATEGLTAFAA